MAAPLFQSISKTQITPINANSIYFGAKRVIGGDSKPYIFSARGSDGVVIIDISDKENPVTILAQRTEDTTGAVSGHPCRSFIPVGVPGTAGAQAFSITRAGSYVSGTNTSRLQEWDISDIDPANWGPTGGTSNGVYEITSAVPSTIMLYSAMETDGGYLYIAGQKEGMAKFDITSILTGPVATNLPVSSETQGLAVGSAHTFFCHYIHGVYATLNSTLATTDTIAAPVGPYGSRRPWDAKLSPDEKYLYVAFNSLRDAGETPEVESGIIIYDVSDPTAMVELSVLATPVASRSVWTPLPDAIVGDPPLLRCSLAGNFFYCANGYNGTITFEISDPSNPVFLNNQGNLLSTDSIADVLIWEEGSDIFAWYGSGYDALPPIVGSKDFYIDQVYPRGIMTFEIGNSDFAGASVSTGLVVDRALSTATNKTRTALAGDSVSSCQIKVLDSGGARTFEMGIYPAPSGIPDLGSPIAGTVVNWENTNTGGTTISPILNFSPVDLSEGTEYAAVVIQSGGFSGSVVSVVPASGSGRVVNSVSPTNALPDPFGASGSSGVDIALVFYGDTASTTKPTLTAPYSMIQSLISPMIGSFIK